MTATTSPGRPDERARLRPVAAWLLVCCALLFAMVVLGGTTRLTGSGLSIVEWAPIMGAIPPLSDHQWDETFRQYQRSPEYQKKNFGMTLAQFKRIFWFEYAHRLLGRTIGLVFLVPFLYFALSRRLPARLVPRLALLFMLGGLQGLLGWYMVKSGLVNDPHVSHYRLTAHLAVAFLIYGYMFWQALSLLHPRPQPAMAASPALRRAGTGLVALIAVTVLSGGLVAGLKAGFAYNTFPLMDGQWIPPSWRMLQPAWMNLVDNPAAVQFDHRVLALTVLLLVLAFWLAGHHRTMPRRAHRGRHLLLAVAMVQVSLGISTLLLHVPVALAATHQGGALALFSVALFLAHGLRSPAPSGEIAHAGDTPAQVSARGAASPSAGGYGISVDS